MGITNIHLLFSGDYPRGSQSFHVGEPNPDGVFVISGSEVVITSNNTFQINDVAIDIGDGTYTVTST